MIQSTSSTRGLTTIDVEDVKQQEQQQAMNNSTNGGNSTGEICFVGYVLDTYCIDRGTLLDNYEIASLEQPFKHSIHCLVDVPRCVNSGFELLLDPPRQQQQQGDSNNEVNDNDDASELYCRAFQLDQRGNDLLLDLARSSGAQGYCTTCLGPPGAPSRGFRATVYGSIDASTSPPTLQVSRVASIRDGCLGTTPYIPPTSSLNCSSGQYLPYVAAHGSLMLISWGFLLPLGVISAKLLKNPDRPDAALWFTIHRIVQPTGLLVALAGFITILASPVNVLGSGVYDFQFVHALVGTTIMTIGLLQPINAYFRPHKSTSTTSEDDSLSFGEDGCTNRRLWEWCHKGLGYFAIVLGLVNCFVGMALSGKYQNQIFKGIAASWGFLLVYGFTLLIRRCWQSRSTSNNGSFRQSGTSSHHNQERPPSRASPTLQEEEQSPEQEKEDGGVDWNQSEDGMVEVTMSKDDDQDGQK